MAEAEAAAAKVVMVVACSEAVAGASDGPRATLVDAAAVAATVVVWVGPLAEALETG